MQSPLDSAIVLYRAQPFDSSNTTIPSEGSLAIPLQLGPSVNADVEDPVFVADSTLGDHLRYVPPNSNQYATSAIPTSILNGDITFALRYRPESMWTQRLLLSIVDPGPSKHFMLTLASDNKYLSRFWEHPDFGWAQIGAYGTTSASGDRTDTIVVTWDGTAKENKLYINGALDAQVTSNHPRSQAASSPLGIPLSGGSTLYPAGKYFSLAIWDRALSAEEVASLTNNPDWLSGGNTPPPPPPPGVLRIFIDNIEYPTANVFIDNVQVEPPTTGEKIVTITTGQ